MTPDRSTSVEKLTADSLKVNLGVNFVSDQRGDMIFVLGANGSFGLVDMDVESAFGNGGNGGAKLCQ